jgi:ACR3 family arsenite transporter
LLLGLSSITVPWTTLFLSVVLYIVVPVIVAQLWRRSLLAQGGETALARTQRSLQPISLIALLAVPIIISDLSQCRDRLGLNRREGPDCGTNCA